MLLKQWTANWQQTTENWLHAERERLILFLPVALMLGIGLYFALPEEPHVFAGRSMAGGALILLSMLWKKRVRPLALVFFIIAVGFAAAQFRTQQVATPLLSSPMNAGMLEGTVDEVIQDERGVKLVLHSPAIEALPAEKTPVRVRISIRKGAEGLQAGDRVRVRATLYPLPRPTMPGAFDFGRYFYFDRIGAVGFSLGAPEVLQSAGAQTRGEWLNTLRHTIEMQILRAMPEAEGAVSAALIMGNQGSIPEEVAEEMRISGLAHILSISGLHLALAAGIVFFSVRLACVLLPAPPIRFHAKTIAALAALLGAFAYLLLAGSPVPAQRSFVMVAFVLTAILLGRRGISVYSLCWAATGLLLIYPEAMLGASFQMSFAATLGMVAYYERFGLRVFFKGHARAKALNYLTGIVLTSFVATLATSAFVIYHFNRVSTYGMLANMLVLPLSSAVIMPGVVMTLVLMPLGLQGAGLFVLEWGVRAMLWVANLISQFPLATFNVPALSDFGLMAACAGLLLLCLLKTRLRLSGVPLLVFAFLTPLAHTPPDVLISDDAKQAMVRLENGEYTLIKGTTRAFDVQTWLRAQAKADAVPLADAPNTERVNIICDDELCDYYHGPHHFTFVKRREALVRACAEKPDMLAVWWYVRGAECEGVSQLIDRRALENGGAAALWLREEKPVLQFAASNHNRPWNRPIKPYQKESTSDERSD